MRRGFTLSKKLGRNKLQTPQSHGGFTSLKCVPKTQQIETACFQNAAKSAEGSLFRPSLVAKNYKLGFTFSKQLVSKTQQSPERVHSFEEAWSQQATDPAEGSLFRPSLVAKNCKLGFTFPKKSVSKTQQSPQRVHSFIEAWSQQATDPAEGSLFRRSLLPKCSKLLRRFTRSLLANNYKLCRGFTCSIKFVSKTQPSPHRHLCEEVWWQRTKLCRGTVKMLGRKERQTLHRAHLFEEVCVQNAAKYSEGSLFHTSLVAKS